MKMIASKLPLATIARVARLLGLFILYSDLGVLDRE